MNTTSDKRLAAARGLASVCKSVCVAALAVWLLLIIREISHSEESLRELDYFGQVSHDNSVIGLSSARPTLNNDVSLYTGQLTGSYSILHVPDPTIGALDITLGYSGSVFQSMKRNNNEAQASVAGLGFTLETGVSSILCDDHMTADCRDDDYFLSASGSVKALLPRDSFFVPSDGSALALYPVIDTISATRHVVQGWKAVTVDGTQMYYGDTTSNGANRNATWYKLHWCGHTVPGITDGDSLVPCRWDLRRMEISDSGYVNYSYSQDTARLCVIATDSATDNCYSRDVNLADIYTSGGYHVHFNWSSRDDWCDPIGNAGYSYRKRVKLSAVSLRRDDSLLAQTSLDHTYLNSGKSRAFRKLVLTSMAQYGAGLSDSLPATRFFYDTDPESPSYGGVTHVYYPTGACKTVHYSAVDTSEVYSQLNAMTDDCAFTGSRPTVACSRNVGVIKYLSGDQSTHLYKLFAWNGYWQTEAVPDITSNMGDTGIVAGDDWVAIYKRTAASIYTFQWRGGAWLRDTINLSWTPDTLAFAKLCAGNDFLVVVEYRPEYLDDPNPRTRRGYFYKYSDTGWAEFQIFDLGGFPDSSRFSSCMLSEDLFALVTHKKDKTRYTIRCGKYLPQTDELVLDSAISPSSTVIAVGPDYVAWSQCNNYEIGLYDFTDSIFVHRVLSWPRMEYGIVEYLVGLESGPLMVRKRYEEEYGSVACVGFFRTVDGDDNWGTKTIVLTRDSHNNAAFPIGGNDFILQEQISEGHHRYQIASWKGNGWQRTDVLTGIDEGEAWGTQQTCAFWVDEGNELYAIRRDAFGQWGTVSRVSHDLVYYRDLNDQYAPAVRAVTDRVAACGNTMTTHQPRRWLYNWSEEEQKWDTLNLNNYTDVVDNEIDAWTVPALYNGRLIVHCNEGEASFLQEYNGRYVGKPDLIVVDSVVLHADGSLTNPGLTMTYQYRGGILDGSTNTPRFCRATAIGPYLQGDASSTSVHTTSLFYNDLDDRLYGDEALELPDLDDTTFNIDAGGFYLDGISYCSVSDTMPLPDTLDFGDLSDYNRNWLSLSEWSTNRKAGYRALLDSSCSVSEGLQSRQFLSYDSLGRSIRRITPVSDSVLQVDSTVYTDQFGYPFGALVSDNLSYIHTVSDSSVEWLSRTHTSWLTRSISDSAVQMRDASDSTTAIIQRMLPDSSYVDAYNHVTCWRDANERYSAAKYAPGSGQLIASGRNCLPSEMIVQDFEQPALWDRWRDLDGVYQYRDSGSGYTGDYCYHLANTSSAVTWGAKRNIDVDSLYDSLYVFRAWVKATDTVSMWVIAYDVDSMPIAGRYMWRMFPDYGNTSWHQIQGVYNIGAIVGAPCEFIRIQFRKEPGDGYAKFDNVRFNPIDADVITTVYDGITGMPTAELGVENIPVFAEYDAFLRSTVVCDFNKNTLLSLEYNDPVVWSSARDSAFLRSPSMEVRDSLCVVFEEQGFCTYSLDLNFDESNDSGWAFVFVNGDTVRQIASGDESSSGGGGQFWTNVNDTVWLKVHRKIVAPEDPNEIWECKALLCHCQHIYDAAHPAYVKRTEWQTHEDSSVSVVFADGAGELVQTRQLTSVDGEDVVVVQSAIGRNAWKRPQRSYLPYVDLVGATDLTAFSDSSVVQAEAEAYYDGITAADCGDYPFRSFTYDRSIRRREACSHEPGEIYQNGPGKQFRYSYDTSGSDTAFVTTVIDEDSVVTRNSREVRGTYVTNGNLCRKDGYTDSTMIRSDVDLFGQSVATVIDTSGPQSIPIRASYTNDLGLTDSTWKVDYGTISTIYDNAGQLRLMRNDKRRLEGTFVYYKYDDLGRKIEEGSLADSTLFTQDSALSRQFPTSAASPEVSYRWFYDYHIIGSDTLIAPGKLVRVENGDSSYYKQFYYFPAEHRDSAVVKLPFAYVPGSLKAIVHKYNIDGSIKELVICPKLTDTTQTRVLRYSYDNMGRLSSIRRADSHAGADTVNYAECAYDAVGRLTTMRLGTHPDSSVGDTAQIVDYSYDALGRLIAINDTSTVCRTGTGGGTNGDHFAELIHYNIGDSAGYFNGRISNIRSAHSKTLNKAAWTTHYSYNDLSWLTSAAPALPYDVTLGEFFTYDDMGRRSTSYRIHDGDTVYYRYDTTFAGSSRLLWFTGMSPLYTLTYDTLGNLTSDSSRGIWYMSYDYRNLLDSMSFEVGHAYGGDTLNTMCMTYDQTGMLLKRSYVMWNKCDESHPESGAALDDIGKPGALPICPKTYENLYLYDNGVLVATFDKSDNVTDVFVNGPGGMFAAYNLNSDDRLYYYLKDHIGSTRATVNPSGVRTSYLNYYSFGETYEIVANYNTGFQFTGKERISHGQFDFDYFGARYYDPRIGSFTTIDKASQFASGYVYGANNPIGVRDYDGNLSFNISDLWGSIESLIQHLKRTGEEIAKSTSEALGDVFGTNKSEVGPWNYLYGCGNYGNPCEVGEQFVRTTPDIPAQAAGTVASMAEGGPVGHVAVFGEALHFLALGMVAAGGGTAYVAYSAVSDAQSYSPSDYRNYLHYRPVWSQAFTGYAYQDAFYAGEFAGLVAGTVNLEAILSPLQESALLGAAEVATDETGGGLCLYKCGKPTTTTARGWRAGDRMIRFPDQGSEELNWAMNRQILENEMKQGKVIYETYVEADGTQIKATGFLGRERAFLESRNWKYVPAIRGWIPPARF